jgi:type I restriction enzyme, S subunit
MRGGWATRQLGELCLLENGDRGDNYPSKSVQTTSGVPFINAGHLQNQEIDFTAMNYIPRERFELLGNGKIQAGDILFCLRGSLGKFASVGELSEGAIASSLVIIRPHHELLSQFLLAYLQSDHCADSILAYKNGTAQPNLGASSLKKFPIPLPPLREQHRIVAILDEAFAGIATAQANTEKNLENARAIFESHLQSVLRSRKWKWKTLGDLCNDVEYGSSAKSKKEGKVPVLRMGNIQDGQLDWGSLVYTNDEDEIRKYLLRDHDVLFNRTNSPELVGKTAIYRGEVPAIFAGYLIRILRKEEVLDAEFLCYFLNSQIAFDYGKSVVISSVNQANISGTKLKSYPIPAPSLSEQKAIVATLNKLSEETRRLASVYQRKLAALDTLEKTLLHRAFAGELTANETSELIEAVA